MASILFVTSLSLTANPRLYKEMLLAHSRGYAVHVIFFQLGNWTDPLDEQKIKALPDIGFTRLSATRSPFMPWLASTLVEWCARKLVRRFSHPRLYAYAAGKRAVLLQRALQRFPLHTDWVIAHNPTSFLPALEFARRTGAHLGIDVEDYHPGETSDLVMYEALRALQRHTLSEADYVSFAAPLIRREVARDLGGDRSGWLTVLNWFPSAEFPIPAPEVSGRLRLVWFSQHVTANRGLELIVPAIRAAAGEVELHIFGQADPAFVHQYLQGVSHIILHGAVPQTELHRRLSEFDIGLAIDVVADRNRELAITNKILSYLQAGLYLAVTVTEAQEDLMNRFPDLGMLFPPTTDGWEDALSRLLSIKDQIRKGRVGRYDALRVEGWEDASTSLAHLWKSVLQPNL